MFNRPKPKEKKGREIDQMPFFLSDEYKQILEENKFKKISADRMSTLGTTLGSVGSTYKSDFLKEKLLEQNEKRKKDRKNRRNQSKTKEKTEPVADQKKVVKKREG